MQEKKSNTSYSTNIEWNDLKMGQRRKNILFKHSACETSALGTY